MFVLNAWLTRAQVNQITSVQKCAQAIVLNRNCHDYNALDTTGLKRLSDRRCELCLNPDMRKDPDVQMLSEEIFQD